MKINNLQDLLTIARYKHKSDLINEVLLPVSGLIFFKCVSYTLDKEKILNEDSSRLKKIVNEWVNISPEADLNEIKVDENSFMSVFEEYFLYPLKETSDYPIFNDLIAKVLDIWKPNKYDYEIFLEAYYYIRSLTLETKQDKSELLEGYKRLIEKSVEFTRYSKEFTTPDVISDLISQIIEPSSSNLGIYDPCFGMAGLLTKVAQKIYPPSNQITLFSENKNPGFSITGYEIHSSTYLVGLAVTMLSFDVIPVFFNDNALSDNKIEDSKFDIVIMDPPFGMNVPGADILQHSIVKSRNSENLFVQHALRKLGPNGVAVIAVSNGFLFRGGSTREIRKYILNNFNLEGIISIPEGNLIPRKGIPINLLVIRNTVNSGKVWFHKISKTDIKNNDKITLSFDVEKEIQIFKNKEVGENTFWINNTDIADSDYSFSYKIAYLNELDILLSSLKEKNKNVKIVALKEVADVYRGFSFRDFPEHFGGENIQTPYVRIGDIEADHIKSPERSIWIQKEQTDKRFLETGDVLLSADGTIGKIAFVNEQFRNSVPSKSLISIRLNNKNEIDPYYLIKILKTKPYQNWFKSQARGSVIDHLSASSLKDLKIPLVQSNFQKKVSNNITFTDSNESLLKAFEINNFQNINLNELSELKNWIINYNIVNYWNIFEDNKKWNTSTFWYTKISNDTRLNIFKSLCEKLVDSKSLNKDNDRLLYLYSLLGKWNTALSQVNNYDAEWKSFYQIFLSKYQDYILKETELIKGKIHLNCHIINPVLEDTNSPRLLIKLINESPFPLFKIRITTFPYESSVDLSSLGTNEETSWSIKPDDIPGQYTLNIKVEAEKIDRTPFEKVFEQNFEIKQGDSDSTIASLGANPYYSGLPIDKPEMFFGRKNIISIIISHLKAERKTDVIIIEGTRRTGKTSILKYLDSSGIIPEEWMPVFCDLQEIPTDSGKISIDAKSFFYFVSQKISDLLNKQGYQVEIPGYGIIAAGRSFPFDRNILLRKYFEKDPPFDSFNNLFNYWMELVPKPKKILLMFDEFDRLQEAIDKDPSQSHILENIRSLFQHNIRIDVIIAGSQRLRNMRNEYFNILFGLGKQIRVGFFTPDEYGEALKLVEEPTKGRLLFTEEAKKYIVDICALQPYFIQSLCGRVFDCCLNNGKKQVDLSVVDEAIKDLIRDNEHFATLWQNTINTCRKKYLVQKISELSKLNDVVDTQIISNAIKKEGIIYKYQNQIWDDLDELVNLDVLNVNTIPGRKNYRVAVPIFERWLDEHSDFEEIKRRAINEGEGE